MTGSVASRPLLSPSASSSTLHRLRRRGSGRLAVVGFVAPPVVVRPPAAVTAASDPPVADPSPRPSRGHHPLRPSASTCAVVAIQSPVAARHRRPWGRSSAGICKSISACPSADSPSRPCPRRPRVRRASICLRTVCPFCCGSSTSSASSPRRGPSLPPSWLLLRRASARRPSRYPALPVAEQQAPLRLIPDPLILAHWKGGERLSASALPCCSVLLHLVIPFGPR